MLGGTLWFKKHRLRTQLFEDVETFVTEVLDEVSETLFLRGSPTPDPEAVTRFKDAVDHELQRLNADRQHAPGGRVSNPPAGHKAPFPTPSQRAKDAYKGTERYSEQLLPASPRFEQLEGAAGLSQ